MKDAPKIGDEIVARRKVKSNIYVNSICGPVVEVWENACQITTNKGTDIETSWRLYFSDWNFQVLKS